MHVPIFDAWVRDLRDHLEVAHMDLKSSHAMIWVEMHLQDGTKKLHTEFRINEDTVRKTCIFLKTHLFLTLKSGEEPGGTCHVPSWETNIFSLESD